MKGRSHNFVLRFDIKLSFKKSRVSGGSRVQTVEGAVTYSHGFASDLDIADIQVSCIETRVH